MYKVKTNSNPLYNSNINEPITYDFYNNQDIYLGGFNGFNQCKPIQNNHNMDLQIYGFGSHFYSESNLNLNTDIYRFVRIGLKNTSNLTKSRIYFITDEDSEWNIEKSVEFELRPNDEFHYVYTVPMADNPLWKGKITQLRFHPLEVSSARQSKFGDIGVTLSYSFIQFATENLNPDSLAFTFKYDMEGFEGINGTAKVLEYMMQCTSNEKDFYLQSPKGLRLSPKTNRYLRIRQKTDSESKQGIVAYTTTNDKEFSEDKRLFYEITDRNEKFVEYTVDLSKIEDELSQIRLYPMGENSGCCEIDYLVFDTVETTDIDLTLPEKLSCNTCGAYVETSNFSANASMLKYLHINMQNNTLSYNAYIQWITDKDGVYDERKKQRFVIRPMDNEVREYTVGLNQNQYWRDNIIGLRIVPAEELPTQEANVIFGNAYISRDGDTMSQGSEIVEGFLEERNENFLAGWIYNRAGGDIHGYAWPTEGWVSGSNLEKDSQKLRGKFAIISEGNGKEVGIHRTLARQTSGVFDWRIHFQIDNPNAKAMRFCLQDNKQSSKENALLVEIKEGFLYANDVQVINITPYDWYDLRVMVDLDNNAVKVILNDTVIQEHISLSKNSFDTINIFATGEEKLHCVAHTWLYKVGYLFEDNNMWAADKGFHNAQGILSTTELSPIEKNWSFVRKAKGIVDCEISFLVEDSASDASFVITSGENVVTGIQIENGNLNVANGNGDRLLLWENYKTKVWYTAVITINTVLKTAEFRVNGQIKAKNIPIEVPADELTDFRVFAELAAIRVKIARVKPHIYSTVPYIDTTPSRNGLVGMQAWFILGDMWNRVYNQFEMSDKNPYIGFYDDMNIESVDWQVKYMAENGVDFIAPFLYCNLDTPIYSSDNFFATFLNYSEHHTDFKFCVTMGEIWQTMTRDKMMNNVLPYLIENYFKHPSYMKIDNKPVLMMHSFSTMMKHVTPSGMRELLNEMRQQLKNEGFDGLIILGSLTPYLTGYPRFNDEILADFLESGVDAIFPYYCLYTADAAKNYYNNSREKGLKAPMCLGCGWDNRIWAGGHFIINETPAEFEDGMRWMAEKPMGESKLDDLVLLENWSEFGEGHSVQPTNLYGFGYLNAIRKVFTEADELHYNTVPEGVCTALNLTGTYPDRTPLSDVPDKIFPMPEEYKKKRKGFES